MKISTFFGCRCLQHDNWDKCRIITFCKPRIAEALPAARYGNIVDVLDEMHICGIRYYIMLDVQPPEIAFVRNPANGLNFQVTDKSFLMDIFH